MAIAYWMMLPPLSPDKGQSSLIFGSEKKSMSSRSINIDKEPQQRSIKIKAEAYLIYYMNLFQFSNSMELDWSI